MLPIVVLDIARLLKCGAAVLKQTFVVGPEFIGIGVVNPDYLNHVGWNPLEFFLKVHPNEVLWRLFIILYPLETIILAVF